MTIFVSRAFFHAHKTLMVAAGTFAASSGFWMESIIKDSSLVSCEAEVTDNPATKAKMQFSIQSKLPEHQQQRNFIRRMSNVGRFSLLSETATNPSIPVMVLVMTGKPWKPQDFTNLYQNRQLAEKHSRFTAHLDARRNNFVFPLPLQDPLATGTNNRQFLPYVQPVLYPVIPGAELKDRVNDAIRDPMDLDNRLWEVRTATGGSIGQSGAIPNDRLPQVQKECNPTDVETVVIFRAHHCMADGVSLAALFGDLMDEADEIQQRILQEISLFKSRRKKTPWWKKLISFVYFWFWGSIQAIYYQLYLYIVSWTPSNRTPWNILRQAYSAQRGIKSGEDIWEPRSISWMQIASVDEVKQVAKYYSKRIRSHVTVNDVFCSCVSAAIVKLLRYHRTVNPWKNDNLELPFMNLVIPVHIHGGILLPGQSIGNKIGALVARIPCEAGITKSESQEEMSKCRLEQIHRILTERKRTPAAFLAYKMASMMGYWSSSGNGTSSGDDLEKGVAKTTPASSWTSWIFGKAHANASVVITNIRGPDQLVHLDGHPVQATLGFLPLPPGIPLGIVVSSYNQSVALTITAEPWAVPDADQFLGWVQEEYHTLKEQMDK
jgi:diacylglycerol O-acyltransferase / wax synthase